MRLFLCVLLARKPMVTQAVVTGLNGPRFFDVYLPELGLELRIQSEEIQPAPVLADWNKDARCELVLLINRSHTEAGQLLAHPERKASLCGKLQDIEAENSPPLR